MSGTPANREAIFSGKHAPHILFVGDEADAIPPEVFRGVDSCMSGGDAHALWMFNPRSQTGPIWEMERDRTANVVQLSAFRHPNVLTGDDSFAPGAVTREVTLRRINLWTRPLLEGESPNSPDVFLLPSFLEGLVGVSNTKEPFPPLPPGHRVITNPAFSYMVLGEYPSSIENQLIDRRWIYDARRRWDDYVANYGEAPPVGVRPYLGQDVGEMGTDWSMTALRYENFLSRLQGWQGVDVIQTGRRAAALAISHNAYACLVDANGLGAGVWPIMKELGCQSVVRVMVTSSPTYQSEMGEFGLLRDQLWWSLREWLRTAPAMLPPDERLEEELGAATYQVVRGKIKVMDKDTMREVLRRSPDRADALALTFAPIHVHGYVGHDTFSGHRPDWALLLEAVQRDLTVVPPRSPV
jgi:hypothetical protein